MAINRIPRIEQRAINSANQPMPFRSVGQESNRNSLPIERTMRAVNTNLGGSAGQFGAGDRGAYNYVPSYTDNPYDFNNFVQRWRQYVHLYEISWEARKIIRIPVEDALRKDWVIEGIPEQMAEGIKHKIDTLKLVNIIKNSWMLERLLGGCLSYFGLEGYHDDTRIEYHPHEGERLRFMNAIPISRISRVTWDTNPLSQGYMRPENFLVNGQELHVSRALVWDGDPLFDPYDFALTNFRSNISGFGPSKLAPVWDDIIKAIGTRQAAYQLIQMNNAIIASVSDLQDLEGSNQGQAAMSKMKEVFNQISLYKAAMIDGDKIQIAQHSAAFGSVPELIITYLQVLSAGSDVPATRFLGQAPGGLNATGESDLENYYNMVDALQRQKLEPQLRRIYDIIGFQLYPNLWKQHRVKLRFIFPPLWNETDKEKAEANALDIANLASLREMGLISDEKCLEELNSKKTVGVKLDDSDLQVRDAIGDLAEIDPDEQFNRLSGKTQVDMKPKEEKPVDQTLPQTPKRIPRQDNGQQDKTKQITDGQNKFKNSEIQFYAAVQDAGYDPNEFDMDQIKKGYLVEQEHADVTEGNPVDTLKIVMAHLTELPDYYDKLEKMEAENMKIQNYITESDGKFIVHAESGKQLGEYPTRAEAEKRLGQIEYFKHQK